MQVEVHADRRGNAIFLAVADKPCDDTPIGISVNVPSSQVIGMDTLNGGKSYYSLREVSPRCSEHQLATAIPHLKINTVVSRHRLRQRHR